MRKIVIAGTAASLVCAAPAAAFSPGRVIRRDYLHSAVTLTGRVVDPAGQPTFGVPVLAYAGTLFAGDWTRVSGTFSTRTGFWRMVVPRGAPRVIAVNADGARQETIRETIAPSVWFRVASRRGGVLNVFGRIWPAGLYPTLVMKDRAPDGWRTFAVSGVNAHGFFHINYPAGAGARGLRIRVRATTFPVAGPFGPWRAGASAVRMVTVRP